MEEQFPYAAERNFQREYLKDGLHMYPLPIDDNLAALIGLVVAYWGDFENTLNKVIAISLPVSEIAAPEWQRKGFKKRKTLLKDILKIVRFNNYDEASERLIALLGTATVLHRKRNLVAHGTYQFTFAPYSKSCAAKATSFYNQQEETFQLTPENLKQLWHDIAHLSGELIMVINLIGTWTASNHCPINSYYSCSRIWIFRAFPLKKGTNPCLHHLLSNFERRPVGVRLGNIMALCHVYNRQSFCADR